MINQITVTREEQIDTIPDGMYVCSNCAKLGTIAAGTRVLVNGFSFGPVCGRKVLASIRAAKPAVQEEDLTEAQIKREAAVAEFEQSA